MLMTPVKLILFRLFNITLGRFKFFNRLLRRLLEKKLITNKEKSKYVASAQFFDFRELEK